MEVFYTWVTLKGIIMRPLFWGIISTVICFIGWVIVSFVLGFTLGLGGHPPIVLSAALYLFGLTWMFSMPVVIVIEVVQWYKLRRRTQ